MSRKVNVRTAGLNAAKRIASPQSLPLLAALSVTLVGTAAKPAAAQDATWLANPATSNYNTGANWSTGTVPTGTAFFGASSQSALAFSTGTSTIGAWVFNSPTAYTFDLTPAHNLAFFGDGIQIGQGSAAIAIGQGTVNFNNSSSAGTVTLSATSGLGGGARFFDSSSAGHATIVSTDGETFFGDKSSANAAHISISGNADLLFTNSSTAANATITNNVGGKTKFDDTSDAGSASITNSGTLNFQNASSAGSATITNNTIGARANFSDTSTAGNAKITNSGILDFGDSSSAGTATITSNASMNFSGTSNAGNANITNSGVLNFEESSTSGNATITTASGGTLFFLGLSTGGNARFITNTGGSVDFSGTTGPNNDLRISAGSIEGAGTYKLGANGLTVGGNNLSTTVSGVIAGAGGSLVKTGTGTLTLSGVNTYTGPTTVNGGGLIVNGSIGLSSVIVNGGLLGGSGTIGPTAVNGGTFAPAGPAATMTVQGDLVLTTAATYLEQINSTAVALANVNAFATLAGNMQFALSGNITAGHYTIIHATSGLTGTFAPLTTSGLTLSYGGNDVFLDVSAPFATPASVAGLNVNQRNVAAALNKAFNTAGSLPAALFAPSPAGLTQLSGELGTGVIQSSINAAGKFLNAMLDPFITGRGAASTPAAPASAFAAEQPSPAAVSPATREAYAAVKARGADAGHLIANQWSVWGTTYGGSATTDGNAVVGSHDTTSRAVGLVTGADYRVSPDTLVGFAMAGGGTGFTVADGLGHGSSDMFQAGVYASQKFGSAYLSGAFAYGWHDVTTDRTVTAAGFDQLRGRFKADTFSGRLEGGSRMTTSVVAVTPYAALQVTGFNLPDYSERSLVGSGVTALTYGAQTTTATRTELGARFDRSYALETALLTLRGQTAWAHDFGTNRVVTATFQALPGASFVVNGAKASPDAALISAGAELAWRNGLSLLGTFEGEFSENTRSYAGKGSLRYAW